MLWNVTFHLPLAGLWVRVIGWACFWPVKKVDLLGLVAARNQAAGAGKADSLKVKVKSAQSCPTLCNPTDCSLPGSSVHGILQAGVGCHSLLPGVFPTQGSNPGLQHCRQILYHLSH